jgi:hypothetical protein
MSELRILNLGAGVQSTTVYLLAEDNEIAPFDYAIFADTQEEPKAVYDHLSWLESVGKTPILKGTTGKLGDDLVNGVNSTGQRWASIPAYTRISNGPVGQTRRQCTKEYKSDVIGRLIRYEILKLKPRERIPKGIKITQAFGFSMDEPGRAARCRGRFDLMSDNWQCSFPLLDEDIHMTRLDCLNYLEGNVPHDVPRSACVFCPYKSNREWRLLRDTDGEGWKRALEVDESIRKNDAIRTRKNNSALFVHRSGKPLKDVYLEDDQPSLFDMDCEGGCGL